MAQTLDIYIYARSNSLQTRSKRTINLTERAHQKEVVFLTISSVRPIVYLKSRDRPPVSLADQQLRLLSRSGSFGGSSGDFGGSSGDFGSGSSCFSPLPPPSAASSEPTAPVTSTPKQVTKTVHFNMIFNALQCAQK